MAKQEKDEKQDESQQPDKKKKLILIGAVVAVVLAIGGGAAFYLMNRSAPSEDETVPVETQATPSSSIKQVGPGPTSGQVAQIGPMVQVDEFIVNLLDIDTTRYLKAAITLEVDNEQTVEQVQLRMSQIRDAILLLTGNKNFSELRDLQGKMQLRAELLGHINTLLPKGQVKKIYFTNFVIQ